MARSPSIKNQSELVFDAYGSLSTFGTFIACVENVDGPKLIPALNDGDLQAPVQVKTAIALNNIGDIDPSGALVTLDFTLNLYWRDDRLDMPIFWNEIDPLIRKNGVRLERIFKDSAGSFVWLPDIYFFDGIKVVEQGYVGPNVCLSSMYSQNTVSRLYLLMPVT